MPFATGVCTQKLFMSHVNPAPMHIPPIAQAVPATLPSVRQVPIGDVIEAPTQVAPESQALAKRRVSQGPPAATTGTSWTVSSNVPRSPGMLRAPCTGTNPPTPM